MEVNIRDLKNRLSHYLRSLRETGEEIIIKDRNTVIAKLVPFEQQDFHAQERHLLATGQMKAPMRRKTGFHPIPSGRISLSVFKQTLGRSTND